MDYDDQTPPSSPIIGYAAIRDFNTEEYSFECKGPIRQNDPSFSPQGLIARGDLTCTVKQLSGNGNLSFERSDPFCDSDTDVETKYKFFNFPFEPNQETLVIFIHICRKNIAMLENLAQPVHSISSSEIDLLSSNTTLNNNNNNNSDEDRDSQNGYFSKPWDLRKHVGVFLNFILTHCNSLKQMDEDFTSLFNGLRNSIERIENWPITLRSHAGSFEGNKCVSPFYHFFHLNLELRWFYLILSGVNPTNLEWILDDLVYLAWFNYASEKSDWCSTLSSRVSQKTAFNCYCVKELWTMIFHVIEEIKPQGKDFWDFLTVALNRFEKNGSDLLFPLWLVTNVAPLQNYSLQGQFSHESDFNGNCYPFVRQLTKNYLQQVSSSIAGGDQNHDLSQIIELLCKLLPYWGSDDKVIQSMWEYWSSKIDKKGGVQDGNYWKSPTKWVALIKSLHHNENEDSSLTTTTTTTDVLGNISDDFYQFVRLFAGHVRYYPAKKLSKLTTHIYLKFSSGKISSFTSELGLIRFCSLNLTIISTCNREDLLGICKRFNTTCIEVFDLLMKKNKVNSARTVLSALSTMFLLLLEKSIKIPTDLADPFMEQIKELMLKDSNTIQITNKKELVMLYIEFLDAIPKFSSIASSSLIDLGQTVFFCPCISIWIRRVPFDYANRTMRTLHNLIKWQFDSENVCPDLNKKIHDATKPFVSEVVGKININKIILPTNKGSSSSSTATMPATTSTPNINNDVEPVSDLAADFTLMNSSDRNTFESYFENFALNPQTSPEVSQCYIEKILSVDGSGIKIEDLKLLQAWIRLVCIGASVPHKLTMNVLSSDDEDGSPSFLGKTNEKLLSVFCRSASKNPAWDRKVMEDILSPFLKLCERKWSPVKDHLTTIQNLLRSGTVILNELSFDKIYTSNWPKSSAQIILQTFNEYLYPIPLELIHTMHEYLPQAFQGVVSHPTWKNEQNLKTFIMTFLTVSFTSFTKDEFMRNYENHPCVKILKYVESEDITIVREEFLPEMKSIVGEQRLNNHTEYLKTLTLFTRRPLGLAIVIAKSLPVLLRIIRLSEQDLMTCTEFICFLLDPALKLSSENSAADKLLGVTNYGDLLLCALKKELEQNFSLHSKKYFNLFRKMLVCKCPHMNQVRRFMKDKLLDVISHQINICEMIRGYGQDYSLRNQYQTLEAELNRYL